MRLKQCCSEQRSRELFVSKQLESICCVITSSKVVIFTFALDLWLISVRRVQFERILRGSEILCLMTAKAKRRQERFCKQSKSTNPQLCYEGQIYFCCTDEKSNRRTLEVNHLNVLVHTSWEGLCWSQWNSTLNPLGLVQINSRIHLRVINSCRKSFGGTLYYWSPFCIHWQNQHLAVMKMVCNFTLVLCRIHIWAAWRKGQPKYRVKYVNLVRKQMNGPDRHPDCICFKEKLSQVLFFLSPCLK